jgi:hypothetical protein
MTKYGRNWCDMAKTPVFLRHFDLIQQTLKRLTATISLHVKRILRGSVAASQYLALGFGHRPATGQRHAAEEFSL